MVYVSRERFEELTAEAVEALPAWVKEQLDNVVVVIEEYPPPGQPNLLGLYQGVPFTKRGGHYAGLPDRITLFRATIQGHTRDEADLAAEIRHVIVHEIAHLMGISDERLIEMGRY